MTTEFAAAARIDACGHDIYAIDTHYVRAGLDASHLLLADGEAAFVDTGVNSSVAGLLSALQTLNVAPQAVRWVFLTHINLDHAGGAGRLMAALPNATAVIHPRGAPHMAAPEKLIAGARAVYGEPLFTKLYGDIEPIDAARIHVPEDGERIPFGGRALEVLFTEGHARHHYCLHDAQSQAVFTGDSFGISYRVFDTKAGAFAFPTTTPVHFDPVAAHASIDKIVATGARFALLTHYSRVDRLPQIAAQLHEDINRFVAITEQWAGDEQCEQRMSEALTEHLNRRLDAHGVTVAPNLRDTWLAMDVWLNVQGLMHWQSLRRRGSKRNKP